MLCLLNVRHGFSNGYVQRVLNNVPKEVPAIETQKAVIAPIALVSNAKREEAEAKKTTLQSNEVVKLKAGNLQRL